MSSRSLIACFSALLIAGQAAAQLSAPPLVKIIYPKANQLVQAVDSTFVLGHVKNYDPHVNWHLVVNGHPVGVHEDGGFLGFIPIEPGDFVFDARLVELLANETMHDTLLIARDTVPVIVPVPVHTLPWDSLQIAGEHQPPSGDLVLVAGDMLEVWFWGTPGGQAWFSIPGVADSVPMVEAEPQMQPYWGEAVFGLGSVPDSMLVRGIYRGFYSVRTDDLVPDTSLVYHLVPPDDSVVLQHMLDDPGEFGIARILRLLERPDTLAFDTTSSYRVSLNDPEYPFTVRFTDSVQIIRHAPRRGYFSIHQPRGAEALVVGREGGWYHAKLSQSQFAWIDTLCVERLPHGVLPPVSLLKSVRTYSSDSTLLIEFGLKGKHPFRVIVDDSRTLRLQLFGVTSDTDWIRYDFSDSLVDIATWFQPEAGMYEFRLRLTEDLWGYDTYYTSNTFYLQLNKPPARVRKLYGKTIVVDPGHSVDAGAIGPTGYTEAEANLEISLVLADMLRHEGAIVVMTRDAAIDVPLYDRPVIAKAAGADLFVSVHNNALPDGVNPFDNNGTSCYYYHPHSIKLARSIHRQMLEATGLPDHGLYHGNLAVNRPTQYPAVLVECTFMMLPEEEARLKTSEFRHTVARAIVKGIADFLEEYGDANGE